MGFAPVGYKQVSRRQWPLMPSLCPAHSILYYTMQCIILYYTCPAYSIDYTVLLLQYNTLPSLCPAHTILYYTILCTILYYTYNTILCPPLALLIIYFTTQYYTMICPSFALPTTSPPAGHVAKKGLKAKFVKFTRDEKQSVCLKKFVKYA